MRVNFPHGNSVWEIDESINPSLQLERGAFERISKTQQRIAFRIVHSRDADRRQGTGDLQSCVRRIEGGLDDMGTDGSVNQQEQEILRVLDGFHKSVALTGDAMRERASYMDSLMHPTEREQALTGGYYRALAWIESLRKLTSSLHVQATAAANRSLIEIVVDLLLLHHDRTGAEAHRFFVWEKTRRLRYAKGVVEYFKKEGKPLPTKFLSFDVFVTNESANIEAEMVRLNWINKIGNPRFPDRWMDKKLDGAILDADQLPTDLAHNIAGGNVVVEELGCSLEEIYATEYSRMNLTIHGSGASHLASADGPQLDLMAIFSIAACTNLALLATRIVLTDFGFASAPNFRDEWDELRKEKRHLENSGMPKQT